MSSFNRDIIIPCCAMWHHVTADVALCTDIERLSGEQQRKMRAVSRSGWELLSLYSVEKLSQSLLHSLYYTAYQLYFGKQYLMRISNV